MPNDAPTVVLTLALLAGRATPTPSQPAPPCEARGSHQWLATRPSPLDSTMVTVGERVAKICYSRPSARGRSVDSLVPLGVAWRTGANEPTTITVTGGALTVGGAVLAPGRYVILTVPQAEQWILVFHTTPDSEPARMFRTLEQVAQGVGRVERLTDPVEQFTIGAEPGDSAAFVLAWGHRRVRVPVRAAP
jgi:hypothetical protein